MKTVSFDTDEQIMLLQKKFANLSEKLESLKSEKASLEEEVRSLNEKNDQLSNEICMLREKCKRDEIRREAAETVLKAAKTNMNFDSNFEFVILDD